eukprot:g23174.t1
MKRILSSAPYSVAPEALLLDESAQNTIEPRSETSWMVAPTVKSRASQGKFENARNTLSIIREHTSGIDSGIKMYLVTSEFHCPRSEFIFRTGVAVSWCNNLPCIKVQEHEDFQTWRAAQVRGPWSDRGWTSHVAFAVGGEIDGLWAIGAGTKKLARKRAARLALLVAERAQRHGAGPQDPLWDLVERAKQLLEHACSANVEADAVDGALSTGPLNGEELCSGPFAWLARW